MGDFKRWIEVTGEAADGLGVLVIAAGLVVATERFAARLRRGEAEVVRKYRHDLGRGILLGLEFLVAADIIRTVAVDPTWESVRVLGLIVLIRTFLSVALEVELEGRWPWRRAAASPVGPGADPPRA